MNYLERPVNIFTEPNGNEPATGTAEFENQTQTGSSSVALPIWVDKFYLIAKGMSFHTHRRVFRQLDQIGGTATVLKIKTPDGVRVFNRSHHRSELLLS